MSKNVFEKLSEIKEIVSCFMVDEFEQGSNIILVNKGDEDDVTFIDDIESYSWKGNMLRIDGKEMKINSLKELGCFGESLDLGEYILQVL